MEMNRKPKKATFTGGQFCFGLSAVGPQITIHTAWCGFVCADYILWACFGKPAADPTPLNISLKSEFALLTPKEHVGCQFLCLLIDGWHKYGTMGVTEDRGRRMMRT